jgi:membrane protein implicated in regulation of membrane protease activity
MKQLPGQRGPNMPRWLKTVLAVTITLVGTIWLLSLLPFLLLAALILSILLIPISRRLRQEMEEAGFSVDGTSKSEQRRDVNITPWHRQIRNVWRDVSSGKGL